MSSLSITKYSIEHRQIWNEIVTKSKNGNFLQQRDYMDYHAHRFDEQSVVVWKQGKAIAVFPSNRVGDNIVSHGGLTYGGLIYGNNLHAAVVLEIFEEISKFYFEINVKSILYKAIPHLFHKYPAEEDLYALHRLGARIYRRDISSAIRLDSRIKLSDSRKCTIRKSAKFGVEIREGAFFSDFHELLSQVVAKFGSEPVHTLDEMLLLKSRFPNNIRLFGAYKDEHLFAGAIVYDFGHVAHTQYLANSDEGREIGALDFLLARLIEDTFTSRQYFSFGISTEQNGMYLNEGLIFQKEGFGARGLIQDFYEWDLKS